MDVSFRATPDRDLVAEAVVEVQRYPLRVLRVLGLVFTALFAVLGALGPAVVGYSGAAVALVITLGAPAWFLRQTASSAAGFLCVETAYAVGATGISTSTANRDTTTRWPIVSDVVETADMVVVRLSRGGGLLMVPVGGLDEETRAQALGLIRGRGVLASPVK